MIEDFKLPIPKRPVDLREGEEIVRAPSRYGFSGPWGRVPLSEKEDSAALSFRFPWREQPREFYPDGEAGVLVAHNHALKYTRYVFFDAEKEVVFEMHLSEEATDMLRGNGWKRVRELFEQDFEFIKQNPFGERSLDPNESDVWGAQRLRTVNQASKEIERHIGEPVAIKGTGLGPFYDWHENENLTEQYIFMRRLGMSENALSNDLKEIFSVCKMYGVIRVPVEVPSGANEKQPRHHEWLMMERVENGEQMETILKNIVKMRAGRGGQPSEPEPYFEPEKHPDLMQVLQRDNPISGDSIRFDRGSYVGLAAALYAAGLHPRLTDLAGRNILVTKMADERNHYTLIDQRDRSV